MLEMLKIFDESTFNSHKEALKDIEFYAKYFYKYQELVEELQGIVDAVNDPDLTLGKLFVINFLYEISTIKACSGILIKDSQGNILHGRNLDFGFGP